jgi:hypothetical protein
MDEVTTSPLGNYYISTWPALLAVYREGLDRWGPEDDITRAELDEVIAAAERGGVDTPPDAAALDLMVRAASIPRGGEIIVGGILARLAPRHAVLRDAIRKLISTGDTRARLTAVEAVAPLAPEMHCPREFAERVLVVALSDSELEVGMAGARGVTRLRLTSLLPDLERMRPLVTDLWPHALLLERYIAITRDGYWLGKPQKSSEGVPVRDMIYCLPSGGWIGELIELEVIERRGAAAIAAERLAKWLS